MATGETRYLQQTGVEIEIRETTLEGEQIGVGLRAIAGRSAVRQGVRRALCIDHERTLQGQPVGPVNVAQVAADGARYAAYALRLPRLEQGGAVLPCALQKHRIELFATQGATPRVARIGRTRQHGVDSPIAVDQGEASQWRPAQVGQRIAYAQAGEQRKGGGAEPFAA